jgi:hypothetical protein
MCAGQSHCYQDLPQQGAEGGARRPTKARQWCWADAPQMLIKISIFQKYTLRLAMVSDRPVSNLK